MVLSDKMIRNLILERGLIHPGNMNLINPASVNLTLGNTFLAPLETGKPVRLGDEVEYFRHEINDKGAYVIYPGEFVLATTKEYVDVPSNLAAFVQGRSSIGRIGLTTQNAGFVDPGFHGHITLELVNESPNPIALTPGYPVAQLVFFESYQAEKPYCGKYNGQVEATGSRMYMDRKQGDV